MKTSSEEKRKQSGQKSCSNPASISREQAVALHKQGVALLELAEELKKTTEYDQNNLDVDHSKEDYVGDMRIIFLQLNKQLNDQINALRRSQTQIRKAIKQLEEQEKK